MLNLAWYRPPSKQLQWPPSSRSQVWTQMTYITTGWSPTFLSSAKSWKEQLPPNSSSTCPTMTLWTPSAWLQGTPQHRNCPHQDHQRPPHCCRFWPHQYSDPPGPLCSLRHNLPHHPPHPPIWLTWSHRYSTLLVPVLFNKQEKVCHHWRLQFHPSSSQPGCASRLCVWTPPLHYLHAPPWSDNSQTWSQLPFLCWWYSNISLHQTVHPATPTVTHQLPAWYKTLDDIKSTQTKH